MTAPAPRANPLLIGQEAAEADFIAAWRAGRLHHGWLITGPEGVGKATLAFRLARRLLSGTADGGEMVETDPVFRRVAAASHADLLTVELAYDSKRKRMKTQIAVEDVRGIGQFMSLTPAEGGWRVAIIDGAEEMNPASANALLKILEEPPSRAILFLVCGAPGRLLPTIRSRCRRLQLNPLDDVAMGRLLATYLPDMTQDQRAALIPMAEGSPGRALLLAEEQGLALGALVDEVMAAGPAMRMSRVYEIADTVLRGEDGFSLFFELLRAAIATRVRNAARAGQNGAEWDPVWDKLGAMQAETEGLNGDKRQAIVAGLGLVLQRGKVTAS